MTDAIARPLLTPACRVAPDDQHDLSLLPLVVATCLPRPSRAQRAQPVPSAQAVQLAISYPLKARRHRPVNPHAAANALALQQSTAPNRSLQ